ncbi:hypothetical protein BJP27_12295 [Pseudomonas oryzihabitans]|nr:hypothetical protein BJP27_12295 [Pseudomonas psychrotolerans]
MVRYDLLLSGSCRDDFSTDALRVNLLYHLRLTPKQVERLLPPATGVLKRDLPAEEALGWVERLTDAGLGVHLVERPAAPPIARELDLQAQLATLETSVLARPAFGLGQRLHLLMAMGTSLALTLLYLLPGLAGLSLAGAALYAFATLLHQDVVIACALALPTTVLGAWLGLGFLLPLWRQKEPATAKVSLGVEQEPGLYRLVESLCRAMQVRPPRRLVLAAIADIHLDTATRTLVLGLPLMTALTTQQFLASLAHVLGHQVSVLDRLGGGSINATLARLEQLAQGRTSAARLASLTRVSRAWARLLFVAGCRLTRSASQRREARADHYEAMLGGSANFRATALRRRSLSKAWREAKRRSLAASKEQGLASNLLDLVEALLARQADAPTLSPCHSSRYWSRHPADRQRVAWVERLELPGLLDDQRPATVLLDHYGRRSLALTRAIYRLAGRQPRGEAGLTVVDLLPELFRDAEEELQQWSGHAWPESPWLPLHLPLDRMTRALDAGAVCERIQMLAGGTGRAWQEAEKEAQRRCLLAFYEELHIHGLARAIQGEGEFNQQHPLEFRAIDTWQTPARQQLLAIAPLYRQRIELALARPLPGREHARDCYRLIVKLAELYPEVERLREARLLVKEYRTLQRQLQGSPRINELCDFAKQDYQRRVALWLNSPLSLPPVLADVSLGEHLQRHCPQLNPAEDTSSAIYRHTPGLLPALNELHQRAWLHLARWCLSAEAKVDATSLSRTA